MTTGSDLSIREKKDCYLIEAPAFSGCTFGFTKNTLSGDIPGDLQRVLGELNEKGGIASLKQIHSARVHTVEGSGRYEGDGLFTCRRNLVPAVRTADCLPLLFYDKKQGMIGAVHMGWRSAYAGILNNLPCDLSSCTVIASVGLRRCCYRVGEEFAGYGVFRDHLRRGEDALVFDPVSFARTRLVAQGMKSDAFFDLNICSRCSSLNSESFPSYRRDKTDRRTLSFILWT